MAFGLVPRFLNPYLSGHRVYEILKVGMQLLDEAFLPKKSAQMWTHLKIAIHFLQGSKIC